MIIECGTKGMENDKASHCGINQLIKKDHGIVTHQQAGDFAAPKQAGDLAAPKQAGDFTSHKQAGEFASIKQTGDFAAHLPLSDYEDNESKSSDNISKEVNSASEPRPSTECSSNFR